MVVQAGARSGTDAASLLGRAVAFAVHHAGAMVATAAAVAPIQAAALVLAAADMPDAVLIPLATCVLPFAGVQLAAAVLAEGVATGAGRGSPRWWTSAALAARRPDLLLLVAFQGALLFVAFFTFAGAVAIAVWWSVASTVLVLEGFSPRAAISRAFRMMHRRFVANLVRVVGGWAALYVVSFAGTGYLSNLIDLFADSDGASDAASLAPFLLAHIVATPVVAVLVVLVYLEARAEEGATFEVTYG